MADLFNEKTKKIIAGILSIALFAVTLTQNVFAENAFSEAKPEENAEVAIGELADNGLYLISETETVLEDGTIETSRLYSSNNPKLRATAGNGTFRNEKELTFSNVGHDPLKYWVQGYFSWNSSTDTATISNQVFGHGAISQNVSITNEDKQSGSNQGFTFLAGRKYAYISYGFTYVNWAGLKKDAYVYLDVNVDGQSSHN